MVTSLHAVEAGAMENGIEERGRNSLTLMERHGIVTDLLGTPTEAYNAGDEEV